VIYQLSTHLAYGRQLAPAVGVIELDELDVLSCLVTHPHWDRDVESLWTSPITMSSKKIVLNREKKRKKIAKKMLFDPTH
jgi:hypothetical protein